jgi:hypothetical protein
MIKRSRQHDEDMKQKTSLLVTTPLPVAFETAE